MCRMVHGCGAGVMLCFESRGYYEKITEALGWEVLAMDTREELEKLCIRFEGHRDEVLELCKGCALDAVRNGDKPGEGSYQLAQEELIRLNVWNEMLGVVRMAIERDDARIVEEAKGIDPKGLPHEHQ